MTTVLRKRKPLKAEANLNDKKECANKQSDEVEIARKNADQKNDAVLKGSYWLTRIILIRSIAFIYFIAFLVALHQNKQLLGKNGLLPADVYLQRIKQQFQSKSMRNAFLNIPTLLLFTKESEINYWLDSIAIIGLILSALVFIIGGGNMIVMTILWLLYHSLVNVGQTWYSFGWESQLLETGFLAIFFCPLFTFRQLPRHSPPSIIVLYGYRWLIFRIMIGAGLIKIRGDQCWRDLTCMNYHYQTQPVPNPISYYLHQSPEIMHKFETLANHFIELVAPFMIFLTRRFRIVGGLLQVLFQVVLIISGNLSFLNWLTILPSIACFDDYFLSSFCSKQTKKEVLKIESARKSEEDRENKSLAIYIRYVLDFTLACLLVVLSLPVVQNLLSSQQAMNTSFDSFRIVNTYGAFGSITKQRTEVILQGTRNKTIVPDSLGGKWEEYEFKCKPGLITQRPCLISPYHYRLDWLMWFAAFMNYQQNPWLIHFAAKLLVNDQDATSLLAYNPFENGRPPRFIRAEHYSYEYTKLGSEEAKRNWWKRKKIGVYFPAVNLHSLKDYLKSNGWKLPKLTKR